jgi:hypothetical protein
VISESDCLDAICIDITLVAEPHVLVDLSIPERPVIMQNRQSGIGQPCWPCAWPHRSPRSGAAQAARIGDQVAAISADIVRFVAADRDGP